MPKTSRDTKKDCGKPGCPNERDAVDAAALLTNSA
jgi:hypothetical protein